LVSWNCKFNLKVLPSYYYFLFHQHWQLLLKWTDSLLYNSKPNLAEMFSMRSYTRFDTFVQIRQKTWPPCDLVDFQETSSQESLKGLNWNLVYMFLWMSLTCVVTVCAIWKFKMATSEGQSLHWNVGNMGNNIFIFFLRTAEQNLTKLGRDVSCEVLKSCPGLY
jgi:hypothetical protein